MSVTAGTANLRRNFVLNLGGSLGPMLAALFAVPTLVENAGPQRLGVLALIWTITGYLSLLDLGLGRVFVRRFARAATAEQMCGEAAALRRICLWGSLLALSAGLMLSIVLVQAGWLHELADASLRAEAVWLPWIVAVTLPPVIATAMLRGALEGRMRFVSSNLLKLVFGSLWFLVPALLALYDPRLPILAAGIALVRWVGLIAHLALAREMLWPPTSSAAVTIRPPLLPLLREGGWLTVSNVISPLMVNFDRYLVGALVSLAAVSYYAIPQEAVIRALLVPVSLAGALYPLYARGDRESGVLHRRLSGRSIDAVLGFALLLALAAVLLSEPLLRLWLGSEFAAAAAPVAVALSVGLVANGVAQVPFAALQARGRADLTARLHLIELPLFVAAAWALTAAAGLVGASVAWSLRCLVDAVALHWLARRQALLPVDLAGEVRLAISLLLAAAVATAQWWAGWELATWLALPAAAWSVWCLRLAWRPLSDAGRDGEGRGG